MEKLLADFNSESFPPLLFFSRSRRQGAVESVVRTTLSLRDPYEDFPILDIDPLIEKRRLPLFPFSRLPARPLTFFPCLPAVPRNSAPDSFSHEWIYPMMEFLELDALFCMRSALTRCVFFLSSLSRAVSSGLT